MFKRDMTKKELAEEAAYIEMIELKRHCGKQDQYIATYGGIIALHINNEGDVVVKNLDLDTNTFITLKNNLQIYHTGVSRNANIILKDQNIKLKKKQQTPTAGMMRIQEIGYEAQKCLISGDLESFGKSLNEHWNVKKSISKKMSSKIIDDLYEYAISCGALGGKVMGAGGGGYFMFYVPAKNHLSFRKKMLENGFKEMHWQFDFKGTCNILTD